MFDNNKSIDLENTSSILLTEELFKNLAENSEIGIFIYQNKIIYANKALCDQTGYTLKELCNMNVWELEDESCRDEVQELILKQSNGIVLKRYNDELLDKTNNDFKFITKSGEAKVIRSTVQTIVYNNEYFSYGTLVDVNNITESEQTSSILIQAIEKTDDMVRITDKYGTIIFVNDSAVKQSGYSRNELIGQNSRILKSGKHNDKFYKDIWSAILSGETFRGIIVNKRKDGLLYYEEETITPIYDDNNELKYFVVTSKDISERIKTENKLYERATTDDLTHIYNRQKCIEQLDIEINRFKRYNVGFAIIMLDIDDFKNINDTYGHARGDDVLKEISKVITENIRNNDIFARWGGEEFMIIAPNLTIEDATRFSEKLREKISSTNFNMVGNITVSFGLTLPQKHETKDDLLKRVDDAMYLSKANGKNQVHVL